MPTSPTRVAASPTAGRPDDGAGQHYLVGDQPTGAGEGKASSWLHVDMSPWSRRAAPFVAKLRVRGLKHVLVEMPWPMLLLCLLLYYVVGGSSAIYFKKYLGAYRRRTSSAAPTQRGVSSRPLADAVLGWTPHASVFAAGMLEEKKPDSARWLESCWRWCRTRRAMTTLRTTTSLASLCGSTVAPSSWCPPLPCDTHKRQCRCDVDATAMQRRCDVDATGLHSIRRRQHDGCAHLLRRCDGRGVGDDRVPRRHRLRQAGGTAHSDRLC